MQTRTVYWLVRLVLVVLPYLWLPYPVEAGLIYTRHVPPEAGKDDVAVIIGNRTYRHADVPPVDYADRDAAAIRDYALRGLGIPADNLIFLADATESDMRSVFGNEADFQGRLWRLVSPRKSNVFVYYSGHGIPGLKDGRSYLLPVDADPSTAEINGYPLALLYANLAKLEAKSATVLLDACFSGASPKGTLIPRSSVLVRPAAATAPAGGVTVLAASGANEVASWDAKARHGLFTAHFLKAVAGVAGTAPYAEATAGGVTLAAIKGYLDVEMTRQARREYGRPQKASLIGDPAFRLPLLKDAPAAPPVPSPTASKSDAIVHSPPAADAMASAGPTIKLPSMNGRTPQTGAAPLIAGVPPATTVAPPLPQSTASAAWRVQLGGFPQADQATVQWNRLVRAHEELRYLQLTTVRVDLGRKGVWYRLQAGPLDELSARSLCETLKAKKRDCLVVR